MKPLEEILQTRGISYTIEDDILVINDHLCLNNSDIEFPKKVYIDGCLYIENCHNIILSEYLETYKFITLKNTKKVIIPNIIKCTWLDIIDSDIDKFPSELKVDKWVYVTEDFNMDLIPSSFHKSLVIKIYNKCKWTIRISKEYISIGCIYKRIDEWEIFFNKNEYYETEPDTPEYVRIKETFEYAKSIHNNVFK